MFDGPRLIRGARDGRVSQVWILGGDHRLRDQAGGGSWGSDVQVMWDAFICLDFSIHAFLIWLLFASYYVLRFCFT